MNSVKRARADSPRSRVRHPHIGVLFHRARRAIDDEVLRALDQQGYADLRAAHDAVFSFMPAGGARLTELARRARITKQSMGELVRGLEALGYVERIPDPSDGRARIVRYTAKGRRADLVGVRAIRRLERRWALEFGETEMRQLRSTLEQVTRA